MIAQLQPLSFFTMSQGAQDAESSVSSAALHPRLCQRYRCT